MKAQHALIAASLLLAAAPALLPTAAAQHEGGALTINDGTRTLCLPILPAEEDALGVAQSCATATLTGSIDRCWNDGTYNCQVTFTGAVDAGPFTCGFFSSMAAGYARKCFLIDGVDPAPATATARVLFTDVPRDGLTPVTGHKETLQVTFMGIPTINPTTDQETWYPQYIFPTDVTFTGSGCSGAAASVHDATMTVTLISYPTGTDETLTYTIAPPPGRADFWPEDAKAYVATPSTC